MVCLSASAKWIKSQSTDISILNLLAGFVKNSFSLAATVSVLALGMIKFPTGFQKASSTQHGEDILRWGSDYLLACYQGNNTSAGVEYVAQVLFGFFLQTPSITVCGHCDQTSKTP